jgi:hypothetical protein
MITMAKSVQVDIRESSKSLSLTLRWVLFLVVFLVGSGQAWANVNVIGDYQRAAPSNAWHTGTLSRDPASASHLIWTNRAGVKWRLAQDLANGVLPVVADNPYPGSPAHQSFKLVIDSAGLVGFDFGGERYLRIAATTDVIGSYQRNPVKNTWHSGSISFKPNSPSTLRWTNQAGVSWDLTPDLSNKLLLTDTSNPYQNISGGQNFALQASRGVVDGFRFNGEFYSKPPMPKPVEKRQLNGYTGASYSAAIPSTHTAGFSFYSAVWALTDKPLAGLQVGLPGTWLLPDNKDFKLPLLPPNNPVRISMPEQGPTWSTVFQTIEGSGGSWITTRFPSASPKYRMNSTPNGYIDEVSSPGWGFGRTTAMPTSAMGMAQLSNRLLVPPDGLTFHQQPRGEMLGHAWMALPLIPPIDNAGDQSWTFFINSSNFKGPIAFYVPQLWARYSKVYPTIVGRGLDVRPGYMPPPTMEFGTVPMLLQASGNGQVYGRIPRMQFPTNGNGISHLATDMAVYSKAAIFDRVATWMVGGNVAFPKFSTQGRYLPPIAVSGTSPQFTVLGMGKQIKFDSAVQANVFNTTSGKQAFGMQWMANSMSGVLPEFFVQKSDGFEPIAANQLPADISLPSASFESALAGPAYTSNSTWNSPAPATASSVVTLSDGSQVRYAWYKFVDQPSLQGFGWSASQKAEIQSRIEKIHISWTSGYAFMESPSTGALTTLDPNLIVTPPAGMSKGYVPIVIEQWK